MNNLDLYKKRMQTLGGNTKGRIDKNKLDSLKYIIYKEGLGEKIKFNDEDIDVLITQKGSNENYNLAMPFHSSLGIGNLIYRYSDKSYWLIISQNNEGAYFSGSITKAEHKIDWKVGDTIYTSYAAQIKQLNLNTKDMKSSYAVVTTFDNVLNLLIPINDQTKTLKLNDKLMIKQKPFEIVNIDSITYNNIFALTLKQLPIDIYNDDIDNNLARVGQEPPADISNDNYIITGLDVVDLLTGLEQRYIINTPNINGVWSFDNKFGTIISINNEYIDIKFNYKTFGTMVLSYIVDGEVKAQKNIKVAPLL